MCLGVYVRKAGHSGEKGVIMKQRCVGMYFVRAHCVSVNCLSVDESHVPSSVYDRECVCEA